MSYIDWLTSMKLLNPLVTWSYRIMWQTKTIISLLKQCLWLLNLLLYHFTLTSYSLYTQGHANLCFKQCSIFTAYCFQLRNRFEWSKYLLARLLPLDKKIPTAKFPISSYPLTLFGKPCLTMWQIHYQCLWLPSLVSWWLILWVSVWVIFNYKALLDHLPN